MKVLLLKGGHTDRITRFKYILFARSPLGELKEPEDRCRVVMGAKRAAGGPKGGKRRVI